MHFTMLMLSCTGTDDPGNEPPTVNSVSTTPARVYETTTISATAAAGDPEGQDIELTFTWTVNGAEVQSGVLQTLSGAYFDKGDTVVVSVTATDGEAESGATSSADIPVLNSAPSIEGARILPEDATGGDDLSVELEGAADDDDDEVFYAVQWWVGSAMVSTEAVLPADHISRSDSVYARVTPTDGEDDGELVQTDAITVKNSPPVATSVTISPLEAGTNDTLTASGTATDADGDSVVIRLDWYVDGEWAAQGSTLDGRLYFERDQEVYAVATGNDSIEQGEGLASDVVVITNAAPTATDVAIDPATSVSAGDDLTCVVPDPTDEDAEGAATDPDGDPLDFVFAWSVNGSAWTGAVADTTYVGDTIEYSATVIDDEWTCTVTPTDGTASGPSSSASVTVENVYKIELGDLVGMSDTCSTVTNETMYNGCYANDWGFGWTDGGSTTPTSVTIEVNHGISCETSHAYETYLNGVTTSETLTLIYSCQCTPAESEYSIVLTDMTDYVVGGDNEFLFEGVYCEGLTLHEDWDAYAKVSVVY